MSNRTEIEVLRFQPVFLPLKNVVAIFNDKIVGIIFRASVNSSISPLVNPSPYVTVNERAMREIQIRAVPKVKKRDHTLERKRKLES